MMYRKPTGCFQHYFRKLFSLLLAVCVLVLTIPEVSSTAYAASYTMLTGSYLLKNVESGKYLNVAGNSGASKANVTVYSKDGTSGQLFELARTSSGWTALTPSCGPGCRLNVSGQSSVSGANVNIYTDTGHSTQGWHLEKIYGNYILRSADKVSLVLTESGTKNTSNVKIATYSKGSKAQLWALESYTPSVSLSSVKGSVAAGGVLSVTVATAPTYSPISAHSTDSSIATCSLSSSRTDGKGKATLKITGKKAGKTTITVTANGKSKAFEATVSGAPSSGNNSSAITASKINSALKFYGLDVSSVGLSNLGYTPSKYYWSYTASADKYTYKIHTFSDLKKAQKATGYTLSIGGEKYGIQCFGFANLLGYKMTGKIPTESWKKYSSIEALNKAGGLKVGDVVRFEISSSLGHSAMVYSISSGKIKWVECLGGTANRIDIAGFNGNGSDYSFMNKLSNWVNGADVSKTVVKGNRFGYVCRYTGGE